LKKYFRPLPFECVGVVCYTQGSGKGFSMLFFTARVVRHPTLVVLTDRNDLDD
jgi:type I restriction enzyme R subunit